MSEYVFNPASNDGQNGGEHAATALVATFVEILAELDARLIGPARPLKLPCNAWDMQVSLDAEGRPLTLGGLINAFYEDGRTRDLANFFDALQSFAPADDQLDDAMIEAVLRLDATAPVAGHEAVYPAICDAGLEAMQCAVTEGTLVSFAHPRWDFDQGVVACGDDQIAIDHASLVQHVDAIVLRKIDAAREEVTRRNFEVLRGRAFPSLLWGQDVVGQLQRFPSEFLGLTFRRIAKLDDIARRWQSSGAAMPDSGSLELKPESDLTMQNYAEERCYRSSTGEMRTYETHVWIDSGNRIHLLLDRAARTIEIGYIGPHLRTWKH